MLAKIKFLFNRYADAKLLYKLSGDSLLLLSILFFAILISEGLLPGIISSKIGLHKFIFLFFFNLIGMIHLQQKLSLEERAGSSQAFIMFAFFIAFLLIFNSLWNISIFFNLFFSIFSTVTIFIFLQIFKETN